MDIIDKIKKELCLCECKGCFRKATAKAHVDIFRNTICLCEKHTNKLLNEHIVSQVIFIKK
ncbi:MAG: hypothetical protein RR420_00960 [Anaerovoracaceae bacterium]